MKTRTILQDECRMRRHAAATADSLRKLRPGALIEVEFTGRGSKPWRVIEHRSAWGR